MKLTGLVQQFDCELHRDGEFAGLGFISHQATRRRLVYMDDARLVDAITAEPEIACVITHRELASGVPERCGVLTCEHPALIFYLVHNYLARETEFYGASFPSVVPTDVMIGAGVAIPDRNVHIGRRVVIESGVHIFPRVDIGDDVILRSGCVIGSQGFQFHKHRRGVLPVAHAGGVRLERGVEIQANSVVCRAVFGGWTTIGEDSKIDNLIHIAHNAAIGRRCLIAAGAVIGGSVVVGDDVWIGPNATLSNGISVGDRASVTIGAVVLDDVPAGERVSGYFAVPHDQFIAGQIATRRAARGSGC